MRDEDLTARARLRDAGIALIAEGGTRALTARAVSERAGVSQGLVRHHFGSMAGLLQACDEHVAEEIRSGKRDAIDPSPGFDPLASLRAEGREFMIGYLAARLSEPSAHLDGLVDTLIEDATGHLADGVAAGVLTPTADERRRATMLTLYSLGAVALHRHLARQLGVDLSSPDFAGGPGYLDYVRIQLEVFASIFTPAVLEEYRGYLDTLEEQS